MQDDHGMTRMQELLSSYYGTQDQASAAQSRRDIDSPGFDAPSYVKVRPAAGERGGKGAIFAADELRPNGRACWRRRGSTSSCGATTS